jgi:hypothetical protein
MKLGPESGYAPVADSVTPKEPVVGHPLDSASEPGPAICKARRASLVVTDSNREIRFGWAASTIPFSYVT